MKITTNGRGTTLIRSLTYNSATTAQPNLKVKRLTQTIKYKTVIQTFKGKTVGKPRGYLECGPAQPNWYSLFNKLTIFMFKLLHYPLGKLRCGNAILLIWDMPRAKRAAI